MDGARQTFTSRKFSKNTLLIPAIVAGIVILVLVFFALRKSSQVANTISSPDRVTLQKPKATQTLAKNFSYPLRDLAGKEISSFKYTIDSVEKRDEIVVKGKRAVAVSGRTFLVLNIKLTNTYSKTISINVKDYVRLSVNNSSEKMAADIHNDPVEVQADSTKTTRLGFPINDSDKNLTIVVGELSGKKETIKLNLK